MRLWSELLARENPAEASEVPGEPGEVSVDQAEVSETPRESVAPGGAET